MVRRPYAWGANAGWQREIAIFDLGLVLIAARTGDPRSGASEEASRVLLPVAVALGANHLAGALRSPRRWGHWLGVVGNATGIVALTAARRR